jgi:exoribonuclease R
VKKFSGKAAACSIARRVAGADTVINVAKIVADSHIWIEQLMIFYNMEAAATLAASGRGVFRSCEEVAPSQLEAVSQLPADLQWIVNKPATYTNDPAALHSKFHGLYCQVTSPIRRYVDLYNQRLLKEAIATAAATAEPLEEEVVTPIIPWQLITHLNTRSKQIRSYQRHLAFLSAILQTNEKTVQATVVEICETKARLYIHSWKTIVNTIEYSDLSVGDSLTLQFYYNPNRPNWKERMVFEIVS